MLTNERYHEIMAKDRQGIIALIGESQYITVLPREKQSRYIIGTAHNDRAICLVWGDEVEGRITVDSMNKAYEEIAQTSLTIPFLFFCRTSLIHAPHLFECMQIPNVFEGNELFTTLRTLNLRGRPRPARRNEQSL